MAEFGVSFVNMARLVSQVARTKEKAISDKKYVVSWDKNQAPYGKYQEFGTKYQAPQPFIRPAEKDIKRNFSSIAKTVEENNSLLDDELGAALLKAAAKYGYQQSRKYVPVDTGNLKDSLFWAEIE